MVEKNPGKVVVENDTNTKYSSYAGKSMPMNDKFPHFSMIGVFEKYPGVENGIKFVKITSKQFMGKYTVLLFMDNRSSALEIDEWHSFSSSLPEFKELNAGEAIQKLRETEEMLMKKQDFLEKKIEQEVTTAKKNAKTNKRAALQALKRKKR